MRRKLNPPKSGMYRKKEEKVAAHEGTSSSAQHI